MMDSKQFFYLCGLAALIFIGFLGFIYFINMSDYYQEQYYNHLPSVTDKAPAISHYEEKRDESVKQTEQHISEQNAKEMPEGSTIVIGDNNLVAVNNSTIMQRLIPITQDGKLNAFSFLFVAAFFMAFRRTPIVGIPKKYLVACLLSVALFMHFSNAFLWGLNIALMGIIIFDLDRL